MMSHSKIFSPCERASLAWCAVALHTLEVSLTLSLAPVEGVQYTFTRSPSSLPL